MSVILKNKDIFLRIKVAIVRQAFGLMEIYKGNKIIYTVINNIERSSSYLWSIIVR